MCECVCSIMLLVACDSHPLVGFGFVGQHRLHAVDELAVGVAERLEGFFGEDEDVAGLGAAGHLDLESHVVAERYRHERLAELLVRAVDLVRAREVHHPANPRRDSKKEKEEETKSKAGKRALEA